MCSLQELDKGKNKIKNHNTYFIIYFEKKTGINFDTSGIKAIINDGLTNTALRHEIMRKIGCFYYRIKKLYIFYKSKK